MANKLKIKVRTHGGKEGEKREKLTKNTFSKTKQKQK